MYATPSPLPDPAYQPEFYSGTAMKRALAWGVDVILIGVLTLLVALLTLGIGFFFLPILYVGLSFTYRVLTLWGGSATLGMRLMNIGLLTRHGERFDLSHAVLHTLGYALSVGTFLVQLLSIGLMVMSARGQSLSDHVLGTVMINRPR